MRKRSLRELAIRILLHILGRRTLRESIVAILDIKLPEFCRVFFLRALFDFTIQCNKVEAIDFIKRIERDRRRWHIAPNLTRTQKFLGSLGNRSEVL